MRMKHHPAAALRLPLTEFALCAWVGQACPGDRLVYHRGFLSIDTAVESRFGTPAERKALPACGQACVAVGPGRRRSPGAATRRAGGVRLHRCRAATPPDRGWRAQSGAAAGRLVRPAEGIVRDPARASAMSDPEQNRWFRRRWGGCGAARLT